jgi:hypothetical protein
MRGVVRLGAVLRNGDRRFADGVLIGVFTAARVPAGPNFYLSSGSSRLLSGVGKI